MNKARGAWGYRTRLLLTGPKAHLFGDDVAGLASRNFRTWVRMLLLDQVCSFAMPLPNLRFERPANRHPLHRREVFSDLVLCVFAGHDRGDVDHPTIDPVPTKNVTDRTQPAFAKHEIAVVVDPDGLEQPLGLDRLGQLLKVALVRVVAIADNDVDGTDIRRAVQLLHETGHTSGLALPANVVDPLKMARPGPGPTLATDHVS